MIAGGSPDQISLRRLSEGEYGRVYMIRDVDDPTCFYVFRNPEKLHYNLLTVDAQFVPRGPTCRLFVCLLLFEFSSMV